ncbi:MAG: hypothetical protein HY791_24600 [Deltaproteobacteria bacterium]|nr:hypothetical protein [Deltaproteobacteria bacterium]
MISKHRIIFAALALLAGSWGCALPHGSYARPVKPMADGTTAISVGALVPIAAAAGATTDSDSVSAAGIADNFTLVPAAAFDYAFGTGKYFGLELSLLKAFEDVTGTFGFFANPRFELPLNGDGDDRTLTFLIDGNFGYFGSDAASTPFFAPTVGIRYYVPMGDMGLILTQNLGTGFITFAFPGSVAFDLALGKFHIFPEVRWDPTVAVTSEGSGGWVFLSGGLSFMLEL